MTDHVYIVREYIERASAGSALAERDALAALDALVAERDAALRRGSYWRDEREAMGVKLVAAEAERDEAIACLQRVVEADWPNTIVVYIDPQAVIGRPPEDRDVRRKMIRAALYFPWDAKGGDAS